MAASSSLATNSRKLAAFVLIAVFADASLSGAQRRVSADDLEPVASATMTLLQQMTHDAGVIFAGEVVSVRRPSGYAGSGQDAAEGVVTVKFRVYDAVRGCAAGSVYTLREWAGLWTGGERYRVGQRLLVFLHNPNRSGLSSPVHGAEGAIPLRGGGIAPGPYDGSALAASWLVDLRWIHAQAMREGSSAQETIPVSAPIRPTAGVKVNRETETSAAFVRQDSPAAELVPVRGIPTHWTALPPAGERSTQPLAQVLSLCRAWVR